MRGTIKLSASEILPCLKGDLKTLKHLKAECLHLILSLSMSSLHWTNSKTTPSKLPKSTLTTLNRSNSDLFKSPLTTNSPSSQNTPNLSTALMSTNYKPQSLQTSRFPVIYWPSSSSIWTSTLGRPIGTVLENKQSGSLMASTGSRLNCLMWSMNGGTRVVKCRKEVEMCWRTAKTKVSGTRKS